MCRDQCPEGECWENGTTRLKSGTTLRAFALLFVRAFALLVPAPFFDHTWA